MRLFACFLLFSHCRWVDFIDEIVRVNLCFEHFGFSKLVRNLIMQKVDAIFIENWWNYSVERQLDGVEEVLVETGSLVKALHLYFLTEQIEATNIVEELDSTSAGIDWKLELQGILLWVPLTIKI